MRPDLCESGLPGVERVGGEVKWPGGRYLRSIIPKLARVHEKSAKYFRTFRKNGPHRIFGGVLGQEMGFFAPKLAQGWRFNLMGELSQQPAVGGGGDLVRSGVLWRFYPTQYPFSSQNSVKTGEFEGRWGWGQGY